MQQDVLVQGLGHRATACCTSPCARDGPLCNRPVQHPCARGGPLCNGLVHHCLCKRARLCTAACARGLPMCNSLAQHSCTTPRARGAPSCKCLAHKHLCNALAHHPLHITPCAPPLVQEKPHVQMPCTPPLVHHKRPSCKEHSRARPSCNAVVQRRPPMVGKEMEGGGGVQEKPTQLIKDSLTRT